MQWEATISRVVSALRERIESFVVASKSDTRDTNAGISSFARNKDLRLVHRGVGKAWIPWKWLWRRWRMARFNDLRDGCVAGAIVRAASIDIVKMVGCEVLLIVAAP